MLGDYVGVLIENDESNGSIKRIWSIELVVQNV